MDDRIKNAVSCFNRNFNCAQAVFSAFTDLTGLDETDAIKLSAGLGAGMGRLQGTCGAVSGAILVLGSVYFDADNALETKELTYRKTREFIYDFAAKNGSSCCLDLLGVNLNSEEGKQTFLAQNYMKTKCEQYVIDACKLLLSQYLKS